MHTRRRFSDEGLYVLLFGTLQIISPMPASLYTPISELFAFLITEFVPRFHKRVQQNLTTIFPERSPTEIKRLVKKTFATIIWNLFLLEKWYRTPKHRIDRFVELRGKEILDTYAGKPIVAVCAHLGLFPLVPVYLQWEGYPLRYVGRHANNPFANRMMSRMLAKRGIRYYDKKTLQRGIRKAGQWLAQGNILCLHSDQYSGEGVRVTMFGKDVYAPTGAAVFARKYHCQMVGIFIERKRGYRHVIQVEGPYPLRHTNNAGEDIRENTQFFFTRFEHFIRRRPEEWFTLLTKIFR